jgi:hypothetical protein
MMPLDDLRVYLPKYLSAENYDQLISQLRDFPANIDKRMYTTGLESNIIYQGDALDDMPVVIIDNLELGVKKRPCMIISNTCDMDLANKRLFPTTIMYTPIVQLCNYEKILLQYGESEEKIKNHLSDVKSQKVSNMFYLPSIGNLGESIVFLDRILNVSQKYIDRDTVESRRKFSLSDYGFYLFVFKLSIHLSRIREGVNRGSMVR